LITNTSTFQKKRKKERKLKKIKNKIKVNRFLFLNEQRVKNMLLNDAMEKKKKEEKSFELRF